MDVLQKPSNDQQATVQPVAEDQVQSTTPVKRTPEEEAEHMRKGREAILSLRRQLGREALALKEGRITKH